MGSSPQGSVQPDRIDHHTKVIALQNICWAAVIFFNVPHAKYRFVRSVSHGSKRCLALRATPTHQDSRTRPVQCSELDTYGTLLQCEESPERTWQLQSTHAKRRRFLQVSLQRSIKKTRSTQRRVRHAAVLQTTTVHHHISLNKTCMLNFTGLPRASTGACRADM